MSINVSNLARLADSSLAKEMEQFGSLPLDLQEALREEMADQKKSSAKAAAREIMALFGAADEVIEQEVRVIREMRAQIERKKSAMQQINRARAYGTKTNNFLPLAVLLGQVHTRDITGLDQSLLNVPADFVIEAESKAE